MHLKIIQYLKSAEGFVSGEDISRELGVSRSAVWKCIEDLRQEGYKVEAVPHHGYKLAALPDRLIAWEVQHNLGTRKFGCAVHHFAEIGSTMDEAFRLGMSGAPEGTVVAAELQTKGRGRLGRAWVSPGGSGLYFSLLLRPKLSTAEAARLTLLSSVALSEAVEKCSGVSALIKWPNDLLLGGRKLAGILTELRAEVDRVDFAVVGIGLNVNTAHKELPPEATSLKNESGQGYSRVAILQEFLRTFERRYLVLAKQGFGPALEEWRKRSATIGRRVRFEERGHKFEGLATGLADDGGLMVQLDNKQTVKRMAGDVIVELKDKKV
ncbi:MAG: biotin--[acetyl-CoA-carboxylase] ligase [Candidatus Omnitrophica bacterium]|nr:biotin--[acetyl-CoA-carboxylase] ligase [Candidatus Omnitrophota bacterium]